jgi:hypothetical protein
MRFIGGDEVDRAWILCDTNRTYGNWTYDTATVELVQSIAFPICTTLDPNPDSIGNKSALGNNLIPGEKKNHLKVLNGLTQHPKIEVDIYNTHNTHLIVYDSFGKLIRRDVITNENEVIDYSSIKPGVYHAILLRSGRAVDRLSFGKL